MKVNKAGSRKARAGADVATAKNRITPKAAHSQNFTSETRVVHDQTAMFVQVMYVHQNVIDCDSELSQHKVTSLDLSQATKLLSQGH